MSTPSVVNCLSEVRPPITRHDPSKWADTFSNISIDQQVQRKYREEIEALKQQVGGMLKAAATPTEQMILIDTLERLGVAYHFETEIEQKLQQIYIADEDVRGDYDLFTTSLQFRLFRQHQHPISCDVFAKFMDKDGKFEESLSSDVEGILSLYEAAHVGFRDETLLQDAARFSRHHLRGMEAVLESPLREKVQRALEHPFHRDVPIFYAYFFISNIYQKDDSRNDLLLKLAKLSLMFLQNLYKEELCELTRWWNEFDLKSKLTYARDRLVESYMWGVAYHYEPQYSYVRTGYAKSLQIVTMMDDTYDNYATLDEAELFTQILDRWNIDETDRLPDYMKIVYQFIISAFQDYERNATKFGKEFAAPYFKEMIQQLGRAYNKELKWVMGREMPSFVEYAQNSEVTSTIYIQFAAIIPGLESVTQETIDWMKSEPRIAISTGMLGRYADDIGSYERENKEGKMLTAVECYMKQYGASKQEALRKFGERIEELWKDINKEFVATTYIPRETTVHFLNYGRMCDASYGDKNKDGYTDPKVYQSLVAALFINPMIL